MRWGIVPFRRLLARLAGGCAAGAALALAPHPAHADTVAEADARALLQEPISVYAVEDMDFGQIALGGNAGQVLIEPAAAPSCTTTGGLVHSGVCTAAEFSGYNATYSFLRVRRPAGNQILLTGPGGDTMDVTDLTFASNSTMFELFSNTEYVRFLVVAADGLYDFYVGGTLNVAADQTPGVYNGTFEVLVNFN